MAILLQSNLSRFASLLAAVLALGCLAVSSHAAPPIAGNSVDFGHVGVDFKIYHEFTYVNKTPVPVKIRVDSVECTCSKVTIADTVVAPGDSSKIRLEFDTIYLFGETSKSFTIATTDPAAPIIKYDYYSHIGRWVGGIKPEPLSAFLLPGQSSKIVTIPNPTVDKLTFTVLDQADDYYSVKVKSGKVSKGEKAQVEVAITSPLSAGSYFSTFRLQATLPDQKSVILSVPVKIVRY